MKKKKPQKLLIIDPIFLQYCQTAHNQPKSQFLFHKNCSAHDLCIMSLTQEQNIKRPVAFKSHQSKYQESCKKVCMSNNIDYSTKLCMRMYCKLADFITYELYQTLLLIRPLPKLMSGALENMFNTCRV